MTKADWLDFFEAINGRSATEEEIAAALAAGEFQDDAPAVETAPDTRSASATSIRLVPKKHQHKRRSHSQLSLVHKRRNHSRLSLSAQEAQPQAPFANAQAAQAQPTFAGAQTAPVQGVPNQAVQPQAGFANRSSWSTSGFC